MLIVSRAKFFFTFIVCFLGLMFSVPSMLSQSGYDKLPSFMQKIVNLGLELMGGSHIQLLVNVKSVEKDHQESILDETRKQMRKANIRYEKISVQQADGESVISIRLKNTEDTEKVSDILLKIEKSLVISKSDTEIRAVFSKEFFDNFEKRIVEESIEIIRHRIDESGTKEPTILRQGRDRIVLQLPGVDDPSEVKKLLGKTALLTFHGVDETLEPIIKKKNDSNIRLPSKPGVMYLPEERGNGVIVYIPIKKQIALTGKSLDDAQMTVDPQNDLPCVSIKFDSIDGTKKMAELSSKYLHKQFAMVLDGKVLSAPVFQCIINNGHAQITGRFTMKEANELALLLRAGSLPAPLEVVEERTIGPSLGADSISDGKNATIVAFLSVSLFMLLSYGKFGMFSVISLFFNILIIFAGLALLGATLTLPGIAGIALTIGMAVDSNVLIYERMREEIRRGIRPSISISHGYKMAIMTILDSNITTLIGAIVLYEFGSGPIRGFAVTLALGTVVSMFTTFSLTKSIIALWLQRNKKEESIII